MYLKGAATSLHDMVKQFLDFAQRSDANTQAWELVDNRINSLFGATIKVPMPMWKRTNGEVPHFYISLQHANVATNTYSSWLRGGANFSRETSSVNGIEDGSNLAVACPVFPLSETYSHSISNRRVSNSYNLTKYGSANLENPFKNTGEFVAIGCHTHFDKNLLMCEQGGVTCKKDAMTQTNRLNLLRAYREEDVRLKGDSEHRDAGDVSLPSFPGTGCPWFVLSDKNMQDFGIVRGSIDKETYGFTFWFVRNNCDASITFRLNGKGLVPDVYQSMSFGMMDNFDKQSYIFPLFVAGGSQGISQDIWMFRRYKANHISYMVGNSYDLDAQNICLSNSNLLHPTKFNGSSTSNFRIMSPEGEWKDVFSHQQTASVVRYYSCSNIYEWGYPLNAPTNVGYGYHSATPGLGEIVKNTSDTYNVLEPLTPSKFDTPFQKVVVVLNQNIDHNENGIMGVVPNAYMSWSRTMPCGEIEINGEKWLSIPNGWENRMWHYPTKVGVVVNDEWQNDTVRSIYDKLSYGYNEYIMRDRLLIRLE